MKTSYILTVNILASLLFSCLAVTHGNPSFFQYIKIVSILKSCLEISKLECNTIRIETWTGIGYDHDNYHEYNNSLSESELCR